MEEVTQTTIERAAQLVSIAMSIEPRLTSFGLGTYDEARQRDETGVEAVDAEFSSKRAELVDVNILRQVALCADWLKIQSQNASLNRKHTSYGYKHDVERCFGAYIAHGAFIAAAIGLGFDGEPTHAGSPNMYFRISERTLRLSRRETEDKRRSPAR